MHPLQGEAGAPGAHLRRLNPAVSLALAVLAGCTASPRSPNSTETDADRPEDGAIRPDADIDAAIACADDRFGPGLPNLPAADLSLGDHTMLVLCPDQADVFGLDVPTGARVSIGAFGQTSESISLAIERRGVVVREVTRPGGGFLEPINAAQADRIIVRTDARMAVDYTLAIHTAGGTECPASVERMNCLESSVVEALDLLPAGTRHTSCRTLTGSGEMLVRGACGSEAAAFVSGRQSGVGTLCRSLGPFPQGRDDCRFEFSPGDILPVHTETAAGDGARERAPGSPQAWQGEVEVLPSVGLVPAVAGTWRGEVRLLLPEGAVTGAVSVTDEQPRVDLEGFAGQDAAGALVLAATARSPLGVDVVVSPGQPGAEAWSIPLASAVGDGVDRGRWVLDEGGAPEAAAVHVVDTLAKGLSRMPSTGPAGEAGRLLHVRWSPGRAEPCGTCFVPGGFPFVELSGRPGDPDAWDDAVILHELGHWAATTFGRDDSPGGPHDGSRVVGAIAWSEGFADFFAAWQLGDPELLDRRADGPRIRNLETLSEDDPLARGTSDGTSEGLVSERLVAALLWDLFDGGVADDDVVDGAGPPLLEAALGGARGWPSDRGSAGFDLVDFLDVLSCGDAMVGESAGALARARGLPYEAQSPGGCPSGPNSGG